MTVARIALLSLAAALATVPAAESTTFIGPYPCYEEVQIFNSLRHGDFDYCRLKLGYIPGSAECLRIVATTCNVVVPGEPRRVEKRGVDGLAQRIICPPGPPPPSCPAGYPR